MKDPNLPKSWFFAVVLAALLGIGTPLAALAQEEASKGENFSDKPAPQLFQSDCTGGGCHKGPQGLAKGQSQSSLAGFLREHYTNSRESAAALASYLMKIPAGEPKESREARTPRPSRGESANTAPGWEGFFGGSRPAASGTPKPAARSSRAAARPEEEKEKPAAEPPGRGRHTAEKPLARPQRGRQPTASAAPPPLPPEPPVAAAPPPAPSKQQFDIFD
jgi:hypothetical protein